MIGPASNKLMSLPSVPPEVMRTASERHQKGLMSPYIYQILTQVGILYFAGINHVDISRDIFKKKLSHLPNLCNMSVVEMPTRSNRDTVL